MLQHINVKDKQEERAKDVLMSALNRTVSKDDFIELQRKMFRLITWIQERFHNRVAIKAARIAILSKYWDDQHDKMMQDAAKVENKKMIDVLGHIENIPDEIKDYVIKKYLEQTSKLSWIYFYHTRKTIA